MTVGDELVELPVGQLPDVILVFLQSARREQATEQRPRLVVLGWVHDHHVLEDRELVAMRLDQFADVVTFRVNGSGGNGPPIALTAEKDSTSLNAAWTSW